jgi:hypothetical protein
MLRKAKPFPFYYIHPVATKVGGRAYANICRGGKWLMSYQYQRFTDAVYFVHDLNTRLPEICGRLWGHGGIRRLRASSDGLETKRPGGS